MTKLSTATLEQTLNLFARGATVQQVADAIGSSPRMLYRWREKSELHQKPFFLIHKHGAGYWWDLVRRVRAELKYQTDPTLADVSDEDLYEVLGLHDRFLRDEAGQLIERVEEPEPPAELMADIEELQEQARQDQARQKNRPNAPVMIGRAKANDPPERVTGDNRPPELSTADAKPPAWAKPAPRLDVATIGRGADGRPPVEGRFLVSSHHVSAAERRAGTVEITPTGICRW